MFTVPRISYSCRRVATLCLVLLAVATFWTSGDWHMGRGEQAVAGRGLREVESTTLPAPPPEVVFLIIVCGRTLGAGRPGGAVHRMIVQSKVLLKSAVALTKTQLRFIIMSDSEEIFNQIIMTTTTWPIEYQNKMSLQFAPVWYPEGMRSEMINMFKPCCTARLFIPHIIADEDALIYMDTDYVFLGPPEELWAQFSQFDSRQMVSMSDFIRHKHQGEIPQYKEGLDGGIAMFNLTRAKGIEEGWTAAILDVYNRYKKKMRFADQDIFNILFYERPHLLHDLPCEWNFRLVLCRETIRCAAATTDGAALLHGNSLLFVKPGNNYLKEAFLLWQEYVLGTSLAIFYVHLRGHLVNFTKSAGQIACSNIANVEEVFSKRLKIYYNDPLNKLND